MGELPFVVYSDLKMKGLDVCILSFMSKEDVKGIVFGEDDKNQIDQKILSDSSFLKTDTKIVYKIKNYQISIYHSSSSLTETQLKDKFSFNLNREYKQVSSSFVEYSNSEGFRSMWIRSMKEDQDSSLFVDIYSSDTNKGEMNLYEITTR